MTFINQGRHVGTVGLQDAQTLTIVDGEVDPVGTVEFRANFKIHTFLTSGVFEVTGTKPVTMDVMTIAGGGAGNGGGGGAGGMVVSPFSIQPGIYDIIVGAGGSNGAGATSGANSVFRLQGDPNTNVGVTDAIGGGTSSVLSGAGGSGSGAGGQGINDDLEVFATAINQGHNGGNYGGACSGTNARASGGGGGAGSAGSTAGGIGGHGPCGGCRGGGPGGSGGSGLANDYRTGSNIFYAGGGQGGGINLTPRAPDGGSVTGHGGGGSGSGTKDGVQNKGGGGGVSGFNSPGPGTGLGGSGIIVIRAPFPARDGT